VTSSGSPATRILLTGSLVTPGGVVPEGVVAAQDGRIAYAGELRDLPSEWVAVTPPSGWRRDRTLLPGLVDLHCHGGNGGEFGTDLDASRVAVAHHHQHGTTTVVGSLVSAPAAALMAGARTLGELVAVGELAGIHLEGPFLSRKRCGAQNPDALVDVDLDLIERLGQNAGEGALAQMTWAPERPGGDHVPAALAAVGALGALGHTDTDYAGAAAALEAVAALGVRGGLPLATHLFNGMPPLGSRSPGPVGAAIAAAARGEAVVEVIADGVHLDGGTVRMVYDAVGPDHLALVSDAMAASGLPDGAYSLGGLEVTVRDRAARLRRTGTLAGGVSTLLDQVRRLVGELGIPLADAVRAAATTPARAMAFTDVGALRAGLRADLLVVDEDLGLHGVMRSGVWL
jgi:N-acetylglucosamine-6-phosphate deacetylase